MNQKILIAVTAMAFSLCLVVTVNIPKTEEDFSIPAFEYSFTTESDERASVTRNEVIRVSTPEEFAEQTYETEPQKGTIEVAELAQIQELATPIAIPQNRWDITLTEEEIDLLARILWLEAQGECVEGQEAVVEVVFNRMASDRFPDTLYEVLSQRNPVQFCTWKNREAARPTEKEYQSIAQVLDGNTSILRNDTIYFARRPLTRNLDKVIGGHSFCY